MRASICSPAPGPADERAGLVPRLHPSPPRATSGEQSVRFALLSLVPKR